MSALHGFVLGLAILVLGAAPAAQTLPEPAGRVNDFADLLTPDLETSLDRLLQQTEDRTTSEIAVVTVPSLQGLTVEEYAERLFRQWGIGQQKIDNGVLVLVAPSEREMRIEVGYGLEGVLPDGLAGEVIRTNFLPHFRDDDYARGIDEGVRRVAAIVEQNHVLTPEERAALEQAEEAPAWLMIPFLGSFVATGFFMLGHGLGSKTVFSILFGAMFGGIPLTFSLVPLFNAPLFVLGPLAILMAVLGFRVGRKSGAWVAGSSRGRRGWRFADPSSGGSSRGSSWSGSSGSSSSFGGGRSGGGGASGRW